jgi:hypothetical protein
MEDVQFESSSLKCASFVTTKNIMRQLQLEETTSLDYGEIAPANLRYTDFSQTRNLQDTLFSGTNYTEAKNLVKPDENLETTQWIGGGLEEFYIFYDEQVEELRKILETNHVHDKSSHLYNNEYAENLSWKILDAVGCRPWAENGRL